MTRLCAYRVLLKEKHLLCEEDGECFWLGKGQARGIILLASVFPIYITELALFCCFTAFSALQVDAEGRLVFWLPRRMNQ